MKTVAILTQKGGVGKTTIATCLAVAAEQDGLKTVIFDLDSQATATFWSDVRQADWPAVVSIQAVRLPTMLAAAKENGADLAIIDVPAQLLDIIHQAASVADFVFMPSKTGTFDIMSMSQTLNVVRQFGKKHEVLFTQVDGRSKDILKARQTCEKLKAPVCPVSIGQLVCFPQSQEDGLTGQELDPKGKGAEQINQLYKYMRSQLKGKT